MSTTAIIIPAYNAAAWLGEAIQSALAQTQRALEVVVVDDGSTDETATIAQKFAPAVKLLQQKNAGVSAARNHGVAQTVAEWLLFLDADDRLRPDALRSLAARATQGDFGVTHGRSVDFTRISVFGQEHGNETTQGPMPAAAKACFWKSAIATPGAAMIRRDKFSEAGGWDERFNTTADRDLWCRLGMQTEFGAIERVVIERRMHAENMSADKNRARRQAVEVQLAFLAWCEGRGLDAAFLGTSIEEIFERNVRRAMEERAFEAGQWIAGEAGRRGMRSDLFQRARRLAAMPGFARELELRVREYLKR